MYVMVCGHVVFDAATLGHCWGELKGLGVVYSDVSRKYCLPYTHTLAAPWVRKQICTDMRFLRAALQLCGSGLACDCVHRGEQKRFTVHSR